MYILMPPGFKILKAGGTGPLPGNAWISELVCKTGQGLLKSAQGCTFLLTDGVSISRKPGRLTTFLILVWEITLDRKVSATR